MTDTKTLLLLALVWAVAAYLIVPRLWAMYFRKHPYLSEIARVTLAGDGHPGDPVNIGLVGGKDEIAAAMSAAGWHPADPITLRSSARIAADTVLHRPDDDAPVSNLFLFGRKQDLAFEQPVGGSLGLFRLVIASSVGPAVSRFLPSVALVAAGAAIGGLPCLPVHQIDVELVDAHALLGQSFAQHWEMLQQRVASRGRFRFDAGDHDALL